MVSQGQPSIFRRPCRRDAILMLFDGVSPERLFTGSRHLLSETCPRLLETYLWVSSFTNPSVLRPAVQSRWLYLIELRTGFYEI